MEGAGATRDASEAGGAGRKGSTTISIFIGRSIQLTCEYTECKRDRHSLVGCAFSEEAKGDGYEEHATVQTVTKFTVDSVLPEYAAIAEACAGMVALKLVKG